MIYLMLVCAFKKIQSRKKLEDLYTMTIGKAVELLDAEVLSGNVDLKKEIETICGSDMMSDVLAFIKKNALLLTGLCNPQVIRTAEMLDIVCIIFVRGKLPDDNMLALARGKSIAVLATEHYMFTACGILYENGLRGGA